MAVGDVVSDIFTTTGVYNSFQPAAGVEIMITFVGGKGNPTQAGLFNGVDNSISYLESGSGGFSKGANVKIGITNTNYFYCYAASVAPSYSGIQMK